MVTGWLTTGCWLLSQAGLPGTPQTGCWLLSQAGLPGTPQTGCWLLSPAGLPGTPQTRRVLVLPPRWGGLWCGRGGGWRGASQTGWLSLSQAGLPSTPQFGGGTHSALSSSSSWSSSLLFLWCLALWPFTSRFFALSFLAFCCLWCTLTLASSTLPWP